MNFECIWWLDACKRSSMFAFNVCEPIFGKAYAVYTMSWRASVDCIEQKAKLFYKSVNRQTDWKCWVFGSMGIFLISRWRIVSTQSALGLRRSSVDRKHGGFYGIAQLENEPISHHKRTEREWSEYFRARHLNPASNAGFFSQSVGVMRHTIDILYIFENGYCDR